MKKDKRFIVKDSEGSSITHLTQIVVDTETGVNYLFVQSGNAGGLTPLLDRYGKPVISPVED